MASAVMAQTQCLCSRVENRECELVAPVGPDTCEVRDIPCGECACDPSGDLLCLFETALVWEFTDPPFCAQTQEITIATCPEDPPTPVPTPTPTPAESREFVCGTDQRVEWVPPLVCTIEASDFPADAVIQGASMTIVEIANGTALFRNQKATPADGTYQALIFQDIASAPAAGLFGDWPDVDTGENQIMLEPFMDEEIFINLGPIPFPIPVSGNFSSIAQSLLIDAGANIDLTLTADSLFITSNDFTGSRLVSAFAKVDVTITVFYTV
uniref:Uncharacterized protein n=1 Tax=Erythrolobus madagascarensis TaxID=708628 RepID=A0A7S0T7E4_9RHOD